MPVTTTTEIAGPVDVQFQVNLLRNAKAVAPYFTGTVPAEVTMHGNTFSAKWRRIENLTPVTTALTEISGGLAFPTRTGVQPTVTDVTATVQKFGNFIYLNEEVDVVNINATTVKLSEVLGINAGQSLNRLQRNIMEDNATQILAGTATTATGVNSVTYDVSINTNAFNQLERQNALKFTPETQGSQNIGTTPVRPGFWGITHYDAQEDIRLLTGFNSVETYAGQTSTALSEFGNVGGVRFIGTSEASIDLANGTTTTGTATGSSRSDGAVRYDQYTTIMYGMDAVGSLGFDGTHVKETYMTGDRLPAVMMINHGRGSAGAADPLNEVSSMGWKSWHTGVILNSNWIRAVRHTASKLAL